MSFESYRKQVAAMRAAMAPARGQWPQEAEATAEAMPPQPATDAAPLSAVSAQAAPVPSTDGVKRRSKRGKR